ncbi:GNAT family N-acetyltransferase [Azohydromonas lata]|uniref:GNAT family N-acetyltransferase n=1 Tax=Azohydromonas lata TaxID=45677 RepID=UPI0014714362|nr:GNAT family N-acetyltransferase [Azohydromonas lata]
MNVKFHRRIVVLSIEPANTNHFAKVLAWLKVEDEQVGTGFYCNRRIIEKLFTSGEGLCAVTEGKVIGFAVFQMFTDGGEVHIIEVEPSARGQGLGSQLLLAAVETLRGLGVKYVHVECTSAEGEALCRRHGFENYIDPINDRSEWESPLLRLYLSEWRPRPLNPWA